MRRGKRIAALILAVMLGATALTACSGSSGGSGAANRDGKTQIEIKYWLSGLGEEWLKNLIAAFEEANSDYYVTYTATSSHTSAISSFGMEDLDTTDLYFALKNGRTEYMEPLDKLLTTTAAGDEKPLGEKFNSHYLSYEQSADGHYYNLTYGGGMINLYYNEDLFEKAGIRQLPRTTDELTVVCDTLYSQDITPMCHFTNGGYYDFLLRIYMAQYDGTDYYVNHFMTCTDENGNSPSKDVLTKKDGRYYALKAMEKFITPEYTMPGSNTQSHTDVQTMFLNKQAAMMFNGSWIENEMKVDSANSQIKLMKAPVLSYIVNQLTTVKSDQVLRNVITAIDQVTDGEKQLSDFASGEDYAVGGTTISAEDWNRISDARNVVGSNYAEQSAYIPAYSDAKEGAMKFLEFMYSDAGYKVIAETTKTPMPISYSNGKSVDTSGMSETQKLQFKMMDSAQAFADSGCAKEHKIYVDGGASMLANVKYVDKFCTQNVDDRMTADAVWELVLRTIEDNYENNWLQNIGG